MGGETPGSRATASTSTHRFLLPEKGFYTEPFCFQGKCFKFWASRHGPRTAAIKEGRKRASPQGAAALRTELAASGPQRKSRPSPGREARVAFTAHAELLPPIDFFFFSQKPLFSRTLGVFRERIASEFTCLSDSGPPLPGREGAHPLQGTPSAAPPPGSALSTHSSEAASPRPASEALAGRPLSVRPHGPLRASHQSLGGVLASPSPSRGSCRRQARWLCRRGLSGPLQSSSPVAVVATRKSGRIFPMQSTCVHPSKVCTLVSGLSFFFSFFWCF